MVLKHWYSAIEDNGPARRPNHDSPILIIKIRLDEIATDTVSRNKWLVIFAAKLSLYLVADLNCKKWSVFIYFVPHEWFSNIFKQISDLAIFEMV